MVVGTGIHAERLSPNEPGTQLLFASFATGLALVALILAFGPVSGAHLNPAVTVAERLSGRICWRVAAAHVAAQAVGALAGATTANLMYQRPPVAWSATVRSGPALWFAEAVATFGLVVVIGATARSARRSAVAYAVGCYIAAAHWFTASTGFANPAVTIGRAVTNGPPGISPSSVPAFVAAQVLGGVGGAALVAALGPGRSPSGAPSLQPGDGSPRICGCSADPDQEEAKCPTSP